MAFDVIDPNQGNAKGHAYHLGGGNANQQGSHQPGSILYGDSPQITGDNVRLGKGLAKNRNDLGKVSPGRDLGYHTPKARMKAILRRDHAG